MGDMAEDRVYAEADESTEVYVAGSVGVVSVSVAGERVGRFGLAQECSPRDLAGRDGLLAVATETDVLRMQGEGFEPTDFGPAIAVGVHDGGIVAAGEGGRIARLADGRWTELGSIDARVAAIDGTLVATDDGVYRIDPDGTPALRSIGHRAVNDVAAPGAFAATDTGLYAIDSEWRWELEGQFWSVAALGPEQVIAAGAGLCWRWDDDWSTVDRGGEAAIADVAVGERAYAVTETGSLLVGPSFRERSIGATEVVGIAVP